MANDVGNLAAKLTLNAAGFAAGIAAAEKEAASLSASLQKQISQMMGVGQSADTMSLALRGVSSDTIQYIESQKAQLDALRATAVAEREAAEAANQQALAIRNAQREADGVSASLQRQIDSLTGVTREVDAQALAQRGVSAEVINRIKTQEQQIVTLRAAAEAERLAADAAKKAEAEIASAKRLAAKAADAAQIESQRQAAIDRKAIEKQAADAAAAASAAMQRDATRAAQIEKSLIGPLGERIQLLSELTGLLKRGAIDQQTYNRAVEDANARTAVSTKGMASFAGGSNNAAYAIQQLAFGAQDAATQFGTQGLAGAVRAGSNNVIQFASLMNPLYGTVAAVVGVGVALWADYAAKQKNAKDELEEFVKELDKLDEVWSKIESKASELRSKLDAIASIDAINSVDAWRDAWLSTEREMESNNVVAKELAKEYDKLQKQMATLQAEADMKFDLGASGRGIEQEEKKMAEVQKKLDEVRKRRNETVDKGRDIDLRRNRLEAKEESVFAQQEIKHNAAIADAQKAHEKEVADKAAREQEKLTKKAEKDAKSLASLQNSLTSDIKTPEKQIENVMAKLEERQKKINELATDPKQAASINLEAIDAATRELERVKDEQNQSLQFAGAAEFGSTEAFSRSLQTENRSVSENTKQLVDLAKEQLKEARKKKEVELQEASF